MGKEAKHRPSTPSRPPAGPRGAQPSTHHLQSAAKSLLSMQSTVGNQATQRALSSGEIRSRLGAPAQRKPKGPVTSTETPVHRSFSGAKTSWRGPASRGPHEDALEPAPLDNAPTYQSALPGRADSQYPSNYPRRRADAVALQRHTTEGAPPAPQPVEDEERESTAQLQRQAVPTQAGFGRAAVLAQRTATPGATTPLVQRGLFTSLQKLVHQFRFGRVTVTPEEIPADGATTAQAAAKELGTTDVKWSLGATNHGSTIDNAGVIKAGNVGWKDTETATVEVKAQDAKDASHATTGKVTLRDPLFKQRQDYDKFIAGAPYKNDNFGVGINGRFDVSYN